MTSVENEDDINVETFLFGIKHIPKILGNVLHFKHFTNAHGGSTVQFRSVKSGLDPTAQQSWTPVPF